MLFVPSLRRRPLHLAARRPANGAARHGDDLVDIQSERLADATADGPGERLAGCSAVRLDHYHHAIAGALLRGSERDDASATHAGDVIDRPFKILRVILPSVDDDDVLGAAAHEQLAV